ncbi:hypothetical protein BS47DRAFT_216861 [Hydnum rufescens UP504]|uniref:Protein kinase domain-containing protein n=1 Tax=Hydnum rufescens UP504 TaxID=1448309 RepID=A0A9P6AMC5_9AGAM|nr:hypothetical protein BS47DRAFT_216861 [Hydnum rufescens UP504]
MAPELLEEDRPTVLTDIYGFGMTLLEALTGGMPFHDLVGIIQVIRALATRERPALPSPPPSPLAHYIPLIKRCWRGDKNARPDIKHVIAELNWVAEHQHGTLGTAS